MNLKDVLSRWRELEGGKTKFYKIPPLGPRQRGRLPLANQIYFAKN